MTNRTTLREGVNLVIFTCVCVCVDCSRKTDAVHIVFLSAEAILFLLLVLDISEQKHLAKKRDLAGAHHDTKPARPRCRPSQSREGRSKASRHVQKNSAPRGEPQLGLTRRRPTKSWSNSGPFDCSPVQPLDNPPGILNTLVHCPVPYGDACHARQMCA